MEENKKAAISHNLPFFLEFISVDFLNPKVNENYLYSDNKIV
jgi:hypothetical protein